MSYTSVRQSSCTYMYVWQMCCTPDIFMVHVSDKVVAQPCCMTLVLQEVRCTTTLSYTCTCNIPPFPLVWGYMYSAGQKGGNFMDFLGGRLWRWSCMNGIILNPYYLEEISSLFENCWIAWRGIWKSKFQNCSQFSIGHGWYTNQENKI